MFSFLLFFSTNISEVAITLVNFVDIFTLHVNTNSFFCSFVLLFFFLFFSFGFRFVFPIKNLHRPKNKFVEQRKTKTFIELNHLVEIQNESNKVIYTVKVTKKPV